MTVETSSDQAGSESLEIERKYEVPPGAALPGTDVFAGAGFVVDQPVVHELEAVYFDTADGALSRVRIALRRRSGGHDAGWHIKQRGERGVREVSWPFSDQPPEALLSELREMVGDGADELVAIAKIRTRRTIVVLRDAAGSGLVELADDAVRAEDGAGYRRAWREWEAELIEPDPELFSRVEPVLEAAGAELSPSPAKIARATGRLVPWARAAGADAETIARLEQISAADLAAGTAADPAGGLSAQKRGSAIL